jgi:hypothetical protein
MKKQRGTPPRTRWIVDQIAAAFAASRGGPPSAGRRLTSGPEVDGLVSRALEEELARVEKGEKDVKDLKDSKD